MSVCVLFFGSDNQREARFLQHVMRVSIIFVFPLTVDWSQTALNGTNYPITVSLFNWLIVLFDSETREKKDNSMPVSHIAIHHKDRDNVWEITQTLWRNQKETKQTPSNLYWQNPVFAKSNFLSFASSILAIEPKRNLHCIAICEKVFLPFHFRLRIMAVNLTFHSSCVLFLLKIEFTTILLRRKWTDWLNFTDIKKENKKSPSSRLTHLTTKKDSFKWYSVFFLLFISSPVSRETGKRERKCPGITYPLSYVQWRRHIIT
jgi:hypothetical protein